MVLDNVVSMTIPAPDSQYRLIPCACGSDQVVYLKIPGDLWVVRCMDCGAETESRPARHDVQVLWNRRICHEKPL